MKHPTCNISSQLSFFTQTSPRTLEDHPSCHISPPNCRSFPNTSRQAFSRKRLCSAVSDVVALEIKTTQISVALKACSQSLAARRRGGTLGIDSSPHLPKHRTHIRGNLHCGSSQTNNKWTESPYHLSKTVCKVRVRVSTTRSLEGVWLFE